LRVFEIAGGVAGVSGDAGCFDEGGYGVGEGCYGVEDIDGADVGCEFGPALEAVFAGEDELGVGEGDGGALDFGRGEFEEAGMIVGDAGEGGGRAEAVLVEEILGLLLVLFEVWAGR
jgi:hypothetical protein